MAYIGKQPEFTQYPSKFFDGDGSAMTVTLDYAPPNDAALLVFIDGVRQDTSAYNCTGTSCTFTGSVPSGTNNVQVVHMGLTVDVAVPADDTITTVKIQDDAVTAAKIATDAVGSAEIAANAVGNAEMADDAIGINELSATGTASATTYLRGDNAWTAISEYDDSGLQDDIALLGFRVASNGSLAKYNLVDQTVDDFQDTSGIDASASTNESRDATGKYYFGGSITPANQRTSFTASTTWTAPAGTTSVEALVVGGGGGGGGGGERGGGGAGSLIYHPTYSVTEDTTYTVTIGTGGAANSGGADPAGSKGVASVFGTISATGGGGGGAQSNTVLNHTGGVGGSGGGGGTTTGDGTVCQGGTGSAGTVSGGTGFVTSGGTGKHSSGSYSSGGGGGGAGQAGSDFSGTAGGDGGDGKAYTIADGTTSVYYAGGGAGFGNGSNGTGGQGGGGGGAGTANTGGGGGASSAGGSGIVIINYSYSDITYADMTLVSNATTAEAAPTKGDIVFTYTNAEGTNVIGTDITAEYSADNGSNWTSFGIGTSDVQGTTGGHTIVAKHDVALTSASGTAMRYRIKTLNQTSSKWARIQAVSLGWS